MKPYLPLLLAVLLGAAGPVAGPEPLYGAPGAFRVDLRDSGAVLTVRDAAGGETGRYALPGCRFCPGGECGGDGAFELIFPGAAGPMIAVVCHLAAGGQRLSVFAPARDTRHPVLEIAGESFVIVALHPGSLAVSHDSGGQVEQAPWHPGGGEANATDLAEVRALMAATKGRRVTVAEPVDDRDFRALAGRLAEIAESRDGAALVALASPEILLSFGGAGGVEHLRAMIARPWFWPDFARVVEGGGLLMEDWTRGRGAVFPVQFQTWPADLDAYEYLYGDRPGATLRAGPSEHAPAIADLHGRIVARGPFLQADARLRGAGWVHVCTGADGCGFARAEHVRSPIDWRAIFTQDAPGSPWVLETYVAGD